jgi:hypothetical protein
MKETIEPVISIAYKYNRYMYIVVAISRLSLKRCTLRVYNRRIFHNVFARLNVYTCVAFEGEILFITPEWRIYISIMILLLFTVDICTTIKKKKK